MAELCKRHALECDATQRLGITYRDIRKALTSMKGGRQLGSLLDALMHEQKAPDMESTMAYFGLKLVPEKPFENGEENHGWLGLNLSAKDGRVITTSHHTGSPVRHCVMPGDEIVAVDGVRTSSTNKLNTSLKGKANSEVTLMISHEGIVKEHTVKISGAPQHGVKLDGKGNARWRSYIETRQSN